MKFKVNVWFSQEHIFIIKADSKDEIKDILVRKSFMVDGEEILDEYKIGGSKLDEITIINKLED